MTLHALLSMHSPFSLEPNLKRGSIIGGRAALDAATLGGDGAGTGGDGAGGAPTLDQLHAIDHLAGDEDSSSCGCGRGTTTISTALCSVSSVTASNAIGTAATASPTPSEEGRSRRQHRKSLVKGEKQGRKTLQQQQRHDLHDKLVLTHHPSPPEQLGDEGRSFLTSLLDKERATRLGTRDASEVSGHTFFAGFDWRALRAGSLPPPLVPSTDTINAGSVAASGGGFDEDALDGEHKGVSLTEAHRALFAGWEWRDETRMQLELLSAFEREGMTGARLGFFERICCCCF